MHHRLWSIIRRRPSSITVMRRACITGLTRPTAITGTVIVTGAATAVTTTADRVDNNQNSCKQKTRKAGLLLVGGAYDRQETTRRFC